MKFRKRDTNLRTLTYAAQTNQDCIFFLSFFPFSIQQLGKEHPLGRVGEPSDVASVIKFLASNAASFVTGETLSIDGGRQCSCAEGYPIFTGQ